MADRSLRSGYTTGACAAAAAKGATRGLLGHGGGCVEIPLPWAYAHPRPVSFELVRSFASGGRFSCGVVKDAGDDPDVTNGIEVRAAVGWGDAPPGPGPVTIRIDGGEGVGRVTKPGLAPAVGGSAINPVPRAMIEASVREVLGETETHRGGALTVEISVPRGAEVARRTLNHRLGIVGGISILGTTGIVIPMSADAWRATLDVALDVARASGLDRVVLSHGRTSESAAERAFSDLPEEAFVLMGDHVGYSLDAAADRGFSIVVAGQFAKFCKVAAGHFATHVKDSSLDRGVVADLLAVAGFPPDRVAATRTANTAREVFHSLVEGGDRGVFSALTRRVAEIASDRVGRRVPVTAVLFDYAKAELTRAEKPARRATQ